ncbi:MAG: CHAD domain-containing protein [Porticoccaceae bacterium]
MPHEVELKLALPPAAVAAARGHPLLQGNAPQRLLTTYYDTPEWTLRRHGIALRLRQIGADRVQTVKRAGRTGGGLADRPEWEQPWRGAFDFSHIDDASAARVLRACAARLEPAFVTDFTRQTRRFCESGVAIRAMLDVGSVHCGASCEPLCELELELDAGGCADLYALALRLSDALPLWPEARSKAERGYRLCGADIEPAVPASGLSAAQPATAGFRELVAAEVAGWQAGVRLVEEDAKEGVHQVRVALRRLRSLLRLFEPLLPAGFASWWRGRLGGLARELSVARELDVLGDELLAPRVAVYGQAAWLVALRQRLERERAAARAAARELLAAPRQGRAMLEFLAAVYPAIEVAAPAAPGLGDFAAARIARLRRRFRRRFDKLPAAPAEPWHALRIAAKQLRYGLDFFAPLWPRKAVANYRRRLARIQDDLGSIQDLDIAVRRLREWSVTDPQHLADAERLVGLHARCAAAWRRNALRQSRKLLAERPPWKRPLQGGR